MGYNVCKYCGAKDGRAGMLFTSPSNNIENACENCYKTMTTGKIFINAMLSRTDEEIKKTFELINKKK